MRAPFAAPGRNRGVANYCNKLAPEDVLAIYNERAIAARKGRAARTQAQLAAHYRVSQSNIRAIQRGVLWSWLTSR